jgi:hypothetical protein
MSLYVFRAVPLPIIRSSLTVYLALVYVWFEVAYKQGRPTLLVSYFKPYDIHQCQVYS